MNLTPEQQAGFQLYDCLQSPAAAGLLRPEAVHADGWVAAEASPCTELISFC